MPLDHYIPASYLGLFSLDKSKIRFRDRKLFAYNFSSKNLYQTRAGNLCAINNYYDQTVDKLWFFEGDIASAISSIIDQTIDAKQWITTMVPFVCSLLVRTPEFVERFQRRLDNVVGITREFKDGVRLFEFQRLLAPILVGDWRVLEAVGYGQVLLSDVGFLPFFDSHTRLKGVAVSIGPRHVLIIVPNRRRPVAFYDGNKWLPIIQYHKMEPGNLHSYNEAVANFAQKTIIGSTEENLRLYTARPKNYTPPNIEDARLDFISGALTIPHEFTWHRIVSYLEEPPKEVADGLVVLNHEKLDNKIVPFVFLGIGLPDFPSQVSIKKATMFVDLYDIDGFPNET